MSQFYEEVIHEYNPIIKRKTWSKEIRYRLRLLKKKDHEGIVRFFFDMREFKIDEKKALFTENGLYFTVQELDYVITCLLDCRKRIIEKGKADGTGSGSRGENTIRPQTENKLP